MNVKRIKCSDDVTGDCLCGCGEAAYAYTVKGAEGYVDAAPECASRFLAETFPKLVELVGE